MHSFNRLTSVWYFSVKYRIALNTKWRPVQENLHWGHKTAMDPRSLPLKYWSLRRRYVIDCKFENATNSYELMGVSCRKTRGRQYIMQRTIYNHWKSSVAERMANPFMIQQKTRKIWTQQHYQANCPHLSKMRILGTIKLMRYLHLTPFSL